MMSRANPLSLLALIPAGIAVVLLAIVLGSALMLRVLITGKPLQA